MDKKYKLTNEIINVDGYTFYRIKALKDFGNVKKGDKGGYIENENNLSQSGNCWVYNDAKVFDNAKIYDNAKVCNNALVYDNAEIRGNAQVLGYAQVHSNAKVLGNAKVCDDAIVSNNAIVYNNAQVRGDARVCYNAKVYNNAEIYSDAVVSSYAIVYGNAKVYGNASIYGYARVCGDAVIKNNSDYIVFKNWWSSGRYFTWTRSNNMWSVGCFYGTSNELIEKAYKDSKLSGNEYKRVVDYVNSILNVNEYDNIRKNIKERLLSKIRKLFSK